jgi:hypothetical protein
LVSVNNLAGCAFFSKPVNVIGIERCPVMSNEAILNWVEIYPRTNVHLQAWMGQTILHCEKVEAMLK